MARFTDRVVFVSGAGRGQGRQHAVRFAQEGADIIAVDVCAPVGTTSYAMSSVEDLEETRRLVEATSRRILTRQADVRDSGALREAVEAGVREFGRLDVVCANAGISSIGRSWELSDDAWDDMIAINLSGVWRTVKAAIPAMIDGGRGGSIIITSSVAGLRAVPNAAHYAAAKHGLVGLMRSIAVELAPYSIRVNTIHPTNVDTAMFHTDEIYRLFRPELDMPTRAQVAEVAAQMQALPDLPWIEVDDVTNAVMWLASEDARFLTGVTLPVDGGFANT